MDVACLLETDRNRNGSFVVADSVVTLTARLCVQNFYAFESLLILSVFFIIIRCTRCHSMIVDSTIGPRAYDRAGHGRTKLDFSSLFISVNPITKYRVSLLKTRLN